MSNAERMLLDATTRMLDRCFGQEQPTGSLIDSLPHWQDFEDLGLPLAMVPEEAGGFGLELPAAVAALRLLGERAVPLPIADTMAANFLLATSAVAIADAPAALAVPVDGAAPLELEEISGEWRLSGTAPRVPWGRAIGIAVVEATRSGEPVLVRLSSASWQVGRFGTNLAGHPRDDLVFDCPVEGNSVAPLAGGLGSLVRLGAALRTIMMAGAAEAILHLTISYVRGRAQFGRPIAGFQAIQQELARMAGEVAAIHGAAAMAATYLQTDLRPSLALAAARARACEAAGRIATIAHQAHGAIGFSEEYALHALTKLLWAWRSECGGQSYWAEQVAAHVVAAGAAGLWPLVTETN